MAESSKKDKSSAEAESNVKNPVVQREVLISWKAPLRHFKKMDKKRFFIILACILAFFIVLIIVKQFWLMAAIAAVMFLVYVLGTVPPIEVQHTITTLGIETVGAIVKWEDTEGYWFSKKDNQMHLNVNTKLRYPARIIMLVKSNDVEKVNDIVKTRLPYVDLRNQNYVNKVIDGEWVDMFDEKSEK